MKVDRRYFCFGCGATGDVIDFVSRLEGISPKEAALLLARAFSVPHEDKGPPGRSLPRPRQESLRECLARAAEELELSASTVLDIPELECSPREVLLERHHGVLEYTDERIRVAARDVTVEIRGMDLRLGAMSQGALHIRGQVAAVEFIRS